MKRDLSVSFSVKEMAKKVIPHLTQTFSRVTSLFKAVLLQELVKRGVFMSQGHKFISFSYSPEDIEFILSILKNVFKFSNENISKNNYSKLLEGNPPQQVYSHAILPTKKR